jgi:hypothetical protein
VHDLIKEQEPIDQVAAVAPVARVVCQKTAP